MRQVIDIERELTEAGILGGPLAVTRENIAKARQLVAKAHGVTVGVLTGPRRDKHAARARRDAYAALRFLGLSYPDVGKHLGGRDHSTVIAGLRKREHELLPWKELRT